MGDGPHAVILAAGQGKRMRSALPKVLHPLGGRPLILYSVGAVRAATGSAPVVVIPRGDSAVRDLLGDAATCVEQESALGTGDALRSVPEALRDPGPVLVTHGDAPLIRAETFQRLLGCPYVEPSGVHAPPRSSGRSVGHGPGHPRR